MTASTLTELVTLARAEVPALFLVLGSGMGEIARRIEPIASIPFTDLPGMPGTGVQGHHGLFLLGRWDGVLVLLARGRVHYYEGHPWSVVEQPIRWAASLGIKKALLTNAAGGIREDLEPGTLMPICDLIEWNEPDPWRAEPRPSPASKWFLERCSELQGQIPALRPSGIYGAVTGPSYETPADIRALRTAGADAVGMSTSREMRAGVEVGMECGAISLITNRAAGLSGAPLDHAEVIERGKQTANQLAELLSRVIQSAGEAAITDPRSRV